MKYDTGWYTDSKTTTKTEKITPPTKVGYTFKGYYYTNSSGTEFQVIDSSGSIVKANNTFTGDRTIYAKWSASTYTITYYDVSDELTLSPDTYTYGKGATLPTPTKTGHTFVGWYTKSDFFKEVV